LEAFARFLGDCDISSIRRTLYHLHSIIVVPEDPSHLLRTYHPSFPNFITSTDRCTNHNAYINPQKQDLYLFLRCLDIMRRFFGPAMRQPQAITRRNSIHCLDRKIIAKAVILPSNMEEHPPKGSSVDDLFENDTSMTAEVLYANNHWCYHLTNIRSKAPPVEKEPQYLDVAMTKSITVLEEFIEDYLPQWLDWRIKQILPSHSETRKMKLAQDTLDTMHKTHCWMVCHSCSMLS